MAADGREGAAHDLGGLVQGAAPEKPQRHNLHPVGIGLLEFIQRLVKIENVDLG